MQLMGNFVFATNQTRCMSPFLDCYNHATMGDLLLRTLTPSRCLFATELTNMYAKLCSLKTARLVLDETPKKTTFSYNAVLHDHVTVGHWRTTLLLFHQMQRPDCYTLPIVLKACASLVNVRFGEIVHGLVKRGAARCSDMFVGVMLIEMNASCRRMADACCVFDKFLEPDVVLWASMVTGFVPNGCSIEALSFFRRMRLREGNVQDSVTLTSALSACAHLGVSKIGRSCHGFIVRRGLTSDLCLNKALLNLYAKVSMLLYSKNHFESMVVRDVITWSFLCS